MNMQRSSSTVQVGCSNNEEWDNWVKQKRTIGQQYIEDNGRGQRTAQLSGSYVG